MTIKEAAARFGLTEYTLRYYEREGLIPPVRRRGSGIRDYGEEDLGWISLASCLRRAGLPTAAIAEYVRLFRLGDETVPARLALLREQREKLLTQQRLIGETIERLDQKIALYEGAGDADSQF